MANKDGLEMEWDFAVNLEWDNELVQLMIAEERASGKKVVSIFEAFEPLPYTEELRKINRDKDHNVRLNPDRIESYLLKANVMLSDAYFEEEIDGKLVSFLYKDLINSITTRPKRYKKDVISFHCMEKPNAPNGSIQRNRMLENISTLNVRKEKAARDHYISKGVLTRVCKELDDYLASSNPGSDDLHPMLKGSTRIRYITAFINWWFRRVYEVEATFTEESIRQLIKNEPKNSLTSSASIPLSLPRKKVQVFTKNPVA
jgi:hypothetical protein